MTQETAEKALPTVAELEGKVQRLTQQVANDQKLVTNTDAAFRAAVKSSDVDEALATSAGLATAKATLVKSQSQLKTAQSAVNSAKLAANAGKRADIHDAMRQDKSVVGHVNALFSLGAEWVKLEKGEDGALIVNSGGGEIKKTRAPSANGGSRGTASWEVDGQTFTSRELVEAHLDMLSEKNQEHHANGNFKAFSMTREAERIHAQLTS